MNCIKQKPGATNTGNQNNFYNMGLIECKGTPHNVTRQAFFKYTADNKEQGFYHVNKLYKLPWGKLASRLARMTAELSGNHDDLLYYFFPNGYPIDQYRFYTGHEGCFITEDGIFEDFKNSECGYWPLYLADKKNNVRKVCLEILAVLAYEFHVNEALDIMALIDGNFVSEFPSTYWTVFEGVE